MRLRSDVPYATALSGGIDSSSVASVIAELNKQSGTEENFSAFIAHYPNSSQDEYHYARSLAQEKSIHAHVVKVTHKECIDVIDRTVYTTEDGYNLPTGPFLLYEQYRKAGVKISIDGHGADELFAGYIDYPRLIITPELFHMNLNTVSQCFHVLNGMGMSYHTIASYYMKKALKRLLLKKKAAPSSLFSIDQTPYSHVAPPEDIQHMDPICKKLYMDFHYWTLPAILKRFDLCAMAHGVEVRSPFMDWRIVVFAHSLQTRYKLRKGYTKYILRQAMRKIVPSQILNRKQKLGFTNPNQDWLRQKSFKNYILDHINSQDFLHSPFIPGDRVAQQITKAYQQEQMLTIEGLWPYVQMYRLIEMFKKDSEQVQMNSELLSV